MFNNNNKLTYDGEINLILGPMFSSKTSELIRRYKRHKLAGKKCLMVKYSKDNRYDNSAVVSHDNIKVTATPCEYLFEIDDIVQDYKVICIDEIQFYKDGHILCDVWAQQGKIVECSGLNGTFNRTPWPVVSKLLALANNIIFMKAVCEETSRDAIYSQINITVKAGQTEVIGGADKYSPVDRQTYFKNKNYFNDDMFKELTEILTQSNKFTNIITRDKVEINNSK